MQTLAKLPHNRPSNTANTAPIGVVSGCRDCTNCTVAWLTQGVEKAKTSAMLRAALFATLAFAGCGRSPGVADEELGPLVIAPKQKADAINVARAAKDPAELSRALARPYADTVEALGPHTYSLNTATTVDEAGKRVSELSDHTTIELGANTAFHAVYTNAADYGREALFLDNKLYLRPRYQRWHGRAPETPEEPTTIRDSYFDAIHATWDLLAPGVELTDAGAVEAASRQGRKIIVKLAPTPRTPPAEPILQRKWREKRAVEAVAGEIVLDAESGAPLSVRLQGIVSFSRDGRRFSMKLNADGSASAIGSPVALAAPPDDQVVATPERLREVDDRDFLLNGIAPPSRRNPDGTPVPPSPRAFEGSAAPAAGSGSAAASEPKPADDEPKKKKRRKADDEPKPEAAPSGSAQ